MEEKCLCDNELESIIDEIDKKGENIKEEIIIKICKNCGHKIELKEKEEKWIHYYRMVKSLCICGCEEPEPR